MKKLITHNKYEFRYNYYADESGHIWSDYKHDFLTEQCDKNGYKKVTLMTKDKPLSKGHRFSVHRLILTTFYPVPNMEQLQVDHIDGNIENNSLSNLRWTTPKENINNPNTKINRRVYDQDGCNNASAKLTSNQIDSLIFDINSFLYTQTEIMNKYHLSRESLRRFIKRETYVAETQGKMIIPNFKNDSARDTKGSKMGGQN